MPSIAPKGCRSISARKTRLSDFLRSDHGANEPTLEAIADGHQGRRPAQICSPLCPQYMYFVGAKLRCGATNMSEVHAFMR